MKAKKIQEPRNPKFHRRIAVRTLNRIYKHIDDKPLPNKFHSIFVLAQEKLGDAILLLPFLNKLHELFPKVIIDVACTGYNKIIFNDIPFIRNCVSYRPYNSEFRSLIKNSHYDIFYNPKSGPSVTFHYIANKIKADVKVCLDNKYNNPIYNYSLPNIAGKHIIEKYSELLFHYDKKVQLHQWLPEAFSEQPSSLKINKYICINISAGSQSRKWGVESWKKLVKSILAINSKIHIALFSSKKDTNDARQIKSIEPKKITFPLESPNIYYAAGIIKKSKLVISVDTALVHLAAALGKPIVGMYSNDNPNFSLYRPYLKDSISIKSKTKYIKDISPQDVLSAFKLLYEDSI